MIADRRTPDAGRARSLIERLAVIRSARPASTQTPHFAPDDRAELLARWFGARMMISEGGATLLVERHVSLAPAIADRLAHLPEATYFDTETTGLSTGAGTVIFLTGLARFQDGQLAVRQHLLPDFPHERPLLRSVTKSLAATERLVTYNGRSFDLPLLRARLTVNGLFQEQASLPATHDDLLPVARRLWRRPLGGARLAIVESGVLGVRRTSDCPSSEIPGRYFSFLRDGSPDLLAVVLDHNLQDVVSLALLDAELSRLRDGGWRDVGVLDSRGMALELVRGGAVDEALELVERSLNSGADGDQAHHLRRLASRLLVAGGRVDQAEQLWRLGTRRASVEAAEAWIEVARIRERWRQDLGGALDATLAAARVLDIAFALGRGGSISEVGRLRLRVDSRLRRLRRWVAAAQRRGTLQERRIA